MTPTSTSDHHQQFSISNVKLDEYKPKWYDCFPCSKHSREKKRQSMWEQQYVVHVRTQSIMEQENARIKREADEEAYRKKRVEDLTKKHQKIVWEAKSRIHISMAD